MENNSAKNGLRVEDLSQSQLDILKEVGNIGAGNAVTALAQFLNRKIIMTVPRTKIIPVDEVPYILGGTEEIVVSVFLPVLGDAPGYILYVLSEEAAQTLLTSVMPQQSPPFNYDELAVSALKEIGNILAGSYLNALNQMTGFRLLQSLPAFCRDMAGAILSSVAVQFGESGDYAFFIDTEFIDGDKRINSHFFLIPDPGSIFLILKGIGAVIDE